MFNLMQNYGVFTQICVLQDLLKKKQKEQEKQQIGLRQEILNVVKNFIIVATKLEENSRRNVATIGTL